MQDNHSIQAIPVVRRSSRGLSLYGAAVLVDKPQGWTSFDVVKKLRSVTGITKVGHAGSLDPLATGLLICCLGRPATRQIERFMEMEKVYEGRLRLGATTPSYDAETEVQDEKPVVDVTTDEIAATAEGFAGTIQQTPPMYSAVKVEGERLYKKARRGESIDRPPRIVTVQEFAISERWEREVSFRVTCSKGTYIRSLVHDLGQKLGVGAYMTELRRTAIGSYGVDDAWALDPLVEAVNAGTLQTSS